MNDEASPGPARAPRWKKWLLIVVGCAAVAGLLWQALPGAPFPTDLSRVGAGRATLVLAQDNNYVGGAEVMEVMNRIRGEYAGRVDFLVAHLGMADAQVFAAGHGARDGTVLLFAADGRRVGMLQQPRSAEELRHALAAAFGP
jgi:hypothetical protein